LREILSGLAGKRVQAPRFSRLWRMFRAHRNGGYFPLWVIWMQLGVRDDAAAARAQVLGVKVVTNHCPKIETERLAIGNA
jgi:hypothetical protein